MAGAVDVVVFVMVIVEAEAVDAMTVGKGESGLAFGTLVITNSGTEGARISAWHAIEVIIIGVAVSLITRGFANSIVQDVTAVAGFATILVSVEASLAGIIARSAHLVRVVEVTVFGVAWFNTVGSSQHMGAVAGSAFSA